MSCSGDMPAEAQRLQHLCWVRSTTYAAVPMFLSCWNKTVDCRSWNGPLLSSCFQSLGAFTRLLIGEQLSTSAWGPRIKSGLSGKIGCKAFQPQTAPRCRMADSQWLQGVMKLDRILLLRDTRLLSDQLTIRVICLFYSP